MPPAAAPVPAAPRPSSGKGDVTPAVHLATLAVQFGATPLAEPPGKNEEIFPATHLAPLAVRWKELTTDGRHAEAMILLEEIIKASTPMFERLAQYENFHHTVDLSILVQAAREKVARWLIAWDPLRAGGGAKKFFSYFSVCAKRAFLSELSRVTSYRRRFHSTDDSLEKFIGCVDHTTDRHDAAADVKKRVQGIIHRWGYPEEAGAVKFIIAAMTEDEDIPPKAEIINGAMYAYGLSLDLTTYFYQWALFALRDAMYDKVHIPFTKQDIFRAFNTHDPVVDLINVIPWEMFQRVCAVLGGTRIRIPSLESLGKLHRQYIIRREIEATDMTPDDVEVVAARHGITARNAAQVFEAMTEATIPERFGEHELHESDES